MPDWNAVKADFLATGMPYPELAKKWGVSISTLKKRAAREKWAGAHSLAVLISEKGKEPQQELRQEPQQEPEPAPALVPMEYAIESRRDRLQRMLSTTDAMMDRIIDALQIIEPDNTYALAMLVRALKDLREMQGLNKSALDIEEQQARIDKLRSETRIVETDGSSGVLLIPSLDAAPTPPDA